MRLLISVAILLINSLFFSIKSFPSLKHVLYFFATVRIKTEKTTVINATKILPSSINIVVNESSWGIAKKM